MTTTFESVPYQNYRRGDINNPSGVTANVKLVLHEIQELDRAGGGQYGCFAQVKVIADNAGLTEGQTRNIISRLHKRGYIAFIAMRGPRSICRRVVIKDGVRFRTEPKQVVTAEELLNMTPQLKLPGNLKLTQVTRLEVPTVEELRASRPSFLKQSETVLSHSPRGNEMHREDRKEKEKDNPPSAGCSSSFLSEVPEVNGPKVVDEPVVEEVPEKVSHKKKDWRAMVEAQPFSDILKKRFPGYSDIEARLLMNLVNHKGVPPASIGHALENLCYVPREAEWDQPARPMTLCNFCRNFFQVQEVVIREVIGCGQHSNEAEFQRFTDTPETRVKLAISHLKSFAENVTPIAWVNDSKYHSYYLWPDILNFNIDYKIEGHLLVSLLSDSDKADLLEQLGYCASAVKGYCDRLKLDFKTVYGWTYEEVVDAAEKLKAKLKAERDHYHKPECWTPNPWFRNQLAA